MERGHYADTQNTAYFRNVSQPDGRLTRVRLYLSSHTSSMRQPL
jgi:hypothetical protein